MAEINWKSKYTELKAKYMNAVDAAFRIGMEQGMQQAQMQQMQDQAAQQQAAEQGDQGGQDGQPGQEGAPQEGGQPQDSEHPQGSELDQHISTLEGMLGKSELDEKDIAAMKKSLADIRFGFEMKKSDRAAKGIAKALAPRTYGPAKISATAEHNLTPTAKAAIHGQAKIVADIMSQWDSQEPELSKSIIDIVAREGLKKD